MHLIADRDNQGRLISVQLVVTEIEALKLGFTDHYRDRSDIGRTWDDQDINEAYDRGRSFAETL